MRFHGKLLFLVASAVLLVAAVAGAEDVPMADNAYIGNEACLDCHDVADLGLMEHDVHMQIQSFEVQGREVGCEGCHGPGKLHMEESDPELIRTFAKDEDYSQRVCMDCHATKNLPEWNASIHALEAVQCTDCHGVHKRTFKPNEACTACHADARAAFELPSHHPLREGKMECSSCHDPHSATEFMLKTRMRKADLCYTCHQDKEGPFMFEHPPVQEDCNLCHTPHGSVADNLLTANEPTLCLQCHDFHFHTGYRASDSLEVDVGGIERENPFGPEGFQIAYSTNCTQCHARVHGSDTPSQTPTNYGKGLTQ